MTLPFYNWSKTAASNATADSTVNWAEGQAPSSVNDSARAMMASTAAFRDDIAGAIVTGGTATAYTVASNQVFSSLSAMDGKVIAFSPHATNTAGSPAVSLNVDGLGAKSLQVTPGVELPAGFLVSGSPYVALYNASAGVFYLQNSFGNPYSIPIGGSLDFWGSAAPNSSFALMYGQAISRTTYAVLFGLLSTTYGVGDGSSTFNIPDLRGRVVAGKDDMGGTPASRITTAISGLDGTGMGAAGGTQGGNLAANQVPSLNSTGSNSITVQPVAPSIYFPGATSVFTTVAAGGGGAGAGPAFNPAGGNTWALLDRLVGSNSISVNYTNGAQQPLSNIPPTIIGNKLLRLI